MLFDSEIAALSKVSYEEIYVCGHPAIDGDDTQAPCGKCSEEIVELCFLDTDDITPF